MSAGPDLLVLGGGPAGSSLALLAARAGLRVVLVERERFPRDKVCGEFLSAEGCAVLERIGALPRLVAAGGRWMSEMRLTDAGGRAIGARLPRVAAGRRGLGVTRARMDMELLDLAAAAGVDVRTRCEAVEPLFGHGRVGGFRARRVGRSASEPIEASLVAAADGRRSLLARRLHAKLGDPARTTPDTWFGHKVHLQAEAIDLGDRVELHLFDGGYVGLAPVEDDRVNLCLMATVGSLRACGGSPSRLLHERVLANPAVRSTLGEPRLAAPWKSIGPLRFGVRRASAAGALFVGDAAGTVDPFCGAGMSHALIGAEIALPFVIEAAARGGLDDRLGAAYQRRWLSNFGAVTRRVRWLGRWLARPRLAALGLGLLRGPASPLTARLVAATRTGRHG